MIAYSDISTYVLAGGKSTRMGSPKAELIWRHKTFIEHIVDTIKASNLEVNIIAEKKLDQKMQVNTIPDLIPDKGPLGGIYTALTHSKYCYNLILGCDMPCISSQSIHAFISRTRQKCEGALPLQSLGGGDRSLPSSTFRDRHGCAPR